MCHDESIKTVIENSEYWFYIQPNWSYWYGYICYENEDIEMWISKILWHEPTITDVFRVAEEKWYYGIELQHIIDKDYYLWCNEVHIKSYNPTLPLLQQTDETKQQLINLFQS